MKLHLLLFSWLKEISRAFCLQQYFKKRRMQKKASLLLQVHAFINNEDQGYRWNYLELPSPWVQNSQKCNENFSLFIIELNEKLEGRKSRAVLWMKGCCSFGNHGVSQKCMWSKDTAIVWYHDNCLSVTSLWWYIWRTLPPLNVGGFVQSLVLAKTWVGNFAVVRMHFFINSYMFILNCF